MVEPVSIAASVLALLIKVVPIVKGVLDAEWQIKQLVSIVEGIQIILNHYAELWAQDHTGLEPIGPHLETCAKALKRLDDALKEQFKKIETVEGGFVQKVKTEKIKPRKILTWPAWTKDSAKEHLQNIEAAKSSLHMSLTACEAARRREGTRQVLNQGQRNHASLHQEIRDGRFSTEAYLTGLSTKMDAMALASQGPQAYEPSDANADYGDDDDTNEFDNTAGHKSMSRTWVQLPNVFYQMQVYVFESQGARKGDFYTHTLAVDPTMNCCWVSRKYLAQVNLHHQINNAISREERSRKKLVFGPKVYTPTGSTILIWRPIDGPSDVWTTDRFYVFDEIAVPDVHFAVSYRPYESHRPDPEENRRANGNGTSFIDYTLSDEETVQTEPEYLPKEYRSRQQIHTGHKGYYNSQTGVAPQRTEQDSIRRYAQAGPSTRTIPRSLQETGERETAHNSKDRRQSRSHGTDQIQGSRSSQLNDERRRERSTKDTSFAPSPGTTHARRQSKGKQRAYDE